MAEAEYLSDAKTAPWPWPANTVKECASMISCSLRSWTGLPSSLATWLVVHHGRRRFVNTGLFADLNGSAVIEERRCCCPMRVGLVSFQRLLSLSRAAAIDTDRRRTKDWR